MWTTFNSTKSLKVGVKRNEEKATLINLTRKRRSQTHTSSTSGDVTQEGVLKHRKQGICRKNKININMG